MNTDLFLIHCHNREISIYTCSNHSPTKALRFKGEITQGYELDNLQQQENFWQWFKQKIDYQDQLLSFIIASDSDEFQISANLNIHSEYDFFALNFNKLTPLRENNLLAIFTLPHSDFNSDHLFSDETVLEEELIEEEQEIKTAHEFFLSQTRAYEKL